MYPVIRALRERGCEPLVAVPDPDQAHQILGPDAPRLIRSVLLPAPRGRLRAPESFADLLVQRGFGQPRLLERAVRGWQTLYRDEHIESVLLDYAPVAQLAAWTLGLSMSTYSIGFANPRVPIPCYRPGVPQAESLARLGEQRLLASVERVAKLFGQTTGGNLAAWLHAPRRCIRGIRETDAYDLEPEGGYLGPLGALPDLQSFEWPTDGGHRILCYLRWTPQLPAIIGSLESPERTIVCVVPGVPAEWAASAGNRRLRIASRSRRNDAADCDGGRGRVTRIAGA